MNILITYGVNTETPEGRSRLRRVADICVAHGQRVQKSVFECLLNAVQYEQLKWRLTQCVDDQKDSLRIYRLGPQKANYLWTYGKQNDIDFTGPLIV